MHKFKHSLLRSFLAAMLLGLAGSAFCQTILVTEAEAKLPAAPLKPVRGFFRGPEVEVISPRPGEAVQSPFLLKVRFTPLGGTKLDLESLEVKYMVEPKKDLTSRVRPFAKGLMLEIPDAVVPPGKHQLLIRIQDSDGRPSPLKHIDLDISG
jgi:hypothetical protein